MTLQVLVIGGGIAGLAAAYALYQESKEDLSVTVVEKESVWGGKIRTERVDGFVIEGGPDTFVVTKPWAVQLCRQLGIADRLVGTNPQTRNTYILKRGRLHPLPGGLTMMIPTDIGEMVRTGLLSWPAKARMGIDFLIPAAPPNGDESLGEFVTRRLGRAAYENLIEPLMSGIYAGDGDQLSLRSTFPYLRDLELQHGGLVKGALAVRKERARQSRQSGSSTGKTQSAPGSRSLFLTPTTGLAEIPEALVTELEASGAELLNNQAVISLEPLPGGYLARLSDSRVIEADGVILATPAYVSGQLVAHFDASLSAELQSIPYTSTATVTLAYRQEDLPRPLDGYGYVIPRREDSQALACTWTSTKFPHRSPEAYALLRVFIGRAGQAVPLPESEAQLLEIARTELRETMGITAEPYLSRIYRWEKAMPQYNLGHPERLKRIADLMEAHPRLALAGNGYEGIGIPDCIHSGQQAAERLLAKLSSERLEPADTGRTGAWA